MKLSFFNGNKGQINKVFVYVLSIIMVVFAGFLVSKFIFTFLGDVDGAVEKKFYNEFEKNFDTVYTTYGSEKVFKYKVSSQIEYVCFISKKSCVNDLSVFEDLPESVNESVITLFEAGDNIVMFDESDIVNSKSVEGINIAENGGCFCVKPNGGFFSLLFENKRHKVWLSSNRLES